MWASGIDHDWGLDAFATFQHHTGCAVVVAQHVDHFGVKPKLCAVSLGGMSQVVSGQHGIIHEAAQWIEQCRQLVVRVIGERRVLNRLGWIELASLESGPALAHLLGAQQLVGNPELVPQFSLARAVVALSEKDQIPRLDVFGHPVGILDPNELCPVEPNLGVLPRHENGVEVRIGKTDNGR
jgi:hypothetical protein